METLTQGYKSEEERLAAAQFEAQQGPTAAGPDLAVDTPPPLDRPDLNLETDVDLETEVAERKARANQLAEKFAVAYREDPAGCIEKFNSEMTPEDTEGLELTLVGSKGESLLIIDESGKLVEIPCNAENAADVLNQIKKTDEALRGNSHELRAEILRRSQGKIKTFEAYTYGDVSALKGDALKAFLDDPENWTKERQLVHEKIIAEELKKAKALSERLEDDDPTIYALRGNTAAGKSTRLRNDPTFQKAADEHGQPTGAINPDTYKEELKSEEVVFDHQNITHFQAHAEGSSLARAIKKRIAESDSSMIIDQRLNESKDITDLVNESTRTGKKLKFLDVDSPMEVSLARILNRKPGGADPLPPFEAVAEGYEGVRENRRALIEEVRNNPNILNYVLYVSDEKGNSVKVAEKVNGEFAIIAGQEELFATATNPDNSEEVARLGAQVIDDEYIASATERMGLKPEQIQALERYKGKTFVEALTEHSRKIDHEPLSQEEYTQAMMKNLSLTSRTAEGTVDTSASADKAAKMVEGLTPEQTADQAKTNFETAVNQIYTERGQTFTSPDELRQFVESLAQTVNQGITQEGVLIRSGEDSTKFPYTKVENLAERMDQFYQELFFRLNNPKEDPTALAAWAEFRIDQTDHFFADGCGKTAKLVSAWVMMRADRPVPDYTQHGQIEANLPAVRAEYYKHAAKTVPGTDPAAEQRDWADWLEYYKKL